MTEYYHRGHERHGYKIIPVKHVVVSKQIGRGVFSKVYEGTLNQNGVMRKVAIKILKSQERLIEEAYSEIKILQNIQHENVVQLLGIVEIDTSRQPPWLIFEFANRGNLLDLVKRSRIADGTLIRYCRDVARAMIYLHSMEILHKDLAARNVLIDGNTAKVSDFGISSLLTDEEDNDEYYQLAPGNPKWQRGQRGRWASVRSGAIECYTEGKYFKATDVWAFGVLLWEVWSGGEKPYDQNKGKAAKLIKSGKSPLDISRAYQCPTPINSLMEAIFKQNRKLRPEFVYVWRTLDNICPLYPESNEHNDYHQSQNQRSGSTVNNPASISTANVENEQENSSGWVWLLAGAAIVAAFLGWRQ